MKMQAGTRDKKDIVVTNTIKLKITKDFFLFIIIIFLL